MFGWQCPGFVSSGKIPGFGDPSRICMEFFASPPSCPQPRFQRVACELFLNIHSFTLSPPPQPAISEFFVHSQRRFFRAYPVSSRLLSGSYLLRVLYLSIYGPSGFWRRLHWGYVSDLTIFFILKAWEKLTGAMSCGFHCKILESGSLKVVRTLGSRAVGIVLLLIPLTARSSLL